MEPIFQVHNTSPILPIADSLVYNNFKNVELSTFSSCGSFSIISSTDQESESEIYKSNINADPKENKSCDNRKKTNILSDIDRVEMYETNTDNLTLKIYIELKTVSPNTDEEVCPATNVSDSKSNHEVFHQGYPDLESSGSEYMLSEISSSSSSCESLQDSDKIKSKQIHISTENTLDVSRILNIYRPLRTQMGISTQKQKHKGNPAP